MIPLNNLSQERQGLEIMAESLVFRAMKIARSIFMLVNNIGFMQCGNKYSQPKLSEQNTGFDVSKDKNPKPQFPMRTLATTILSVIMATTLKSQPIFEPLPYSYDALEVFIDKTTMEIHYDRHHRAYFQNFLKAIADEKVPGLSMEQIFANMSQYSATMRNNGGGHYNHTLFWKIMSPNGGGKPEGELLRSLEKAFGSYEQFVQQFEKAAMGRFGSGWAWLSVDAQGNLFISSTPNQDNPLMNVAEQRGIPILGLDVWEHAYYLRYQNRRAEYVANFWKVVNWKQVDDNYRKAIDQIKK